MAVLIPMGNTYAVSDPITLGPDEKLRLFITSGRGAVEKGAVVHVTTQNSLGQPTVLDSITAECAGVDLFGEGTFVFERPPGATVQLESGS